MRRCNTSPVPEARQTTAPPAEIVGLNRPLMMSHRDENEENVA
jgi:hypothetical protein